MGMEMWCALSIFFVLNIIMYIPFVRVFHGVFFSLRLLLSFLSLIFEDPIQYTHTGIGNLWLRNVINKVINSGNSTVRKPHDLISYQYKYGIKIILIRGQIDEQRWNNQPNNKKRKKYHNNKNFYRTKKKATRRIHTNSTCAVLKWSQVHRLQIYLKQDECFMFVFRLLHICIQIFVLRLLFISAFFYAAFSVHKFLLKSQQVHLPKWWTRS